MAGTGVVIARDGTVMAELHGEQDRDVVPLDRVPGVLRAAVVATEDRRFYTHAGVDARAIARAVRENVADGEVSQGGSTITQQLAKNALTGDARTLDRKLTEASLALQLEAHDGDRRGDRPHPRTDPRRPGSAASRCARSPGPQASSWRWTSAVPTAPRCAPRAWTVRLSAYPAVD